MSPPPYPPPLAGEGRVGAIAKSGTTASAPLPLVGRGRGVGVGRCGTSVPHGMPPPPDPPPQGGRGLPRFAPCGQQILGGDDNDEFSVDLAFLDVYGAGGHD